ncbi:MAG: glucokinase [Planctomycetota bacterium]
MWTGERYQAVASEGGHADFAPRNELEMELLRYLMRQFGHVSYERILSKGKSALLAGIASRCLDRSHGIPLVESKRRSITSARGRYRNLS